jgi:hypothetical protein
MRAECCAGRRQRRRAPTLWAGIVYAPAALAALLLPKCPLCWSAYLALFGVGFAVPSGAYTASVLAALTTGTFALALFVRRKA